MPARAERISNSSLSWDEVRHRVTELRKWARSKSVDLADAHKQALNYTDLLWDQQRSMKDQEIQQEATDWFLTPNVRLSIRNVETKKKTKLLGRTSNTY